MNYIFSNPIESGTYESLVEFVSHRDHKGLYLLKLDIDDPWLLQKYLNILTGKLLIKNEDFLPMYKGKHIREVDYDHLNRQSVVSDGAIAVNRKGEIVDDHRVVRFLFPELIDEEAKSGAGHASMASVSLFPLVNAYVCSAERKTVKKFNNGKIRKRYEAP